MHDPPGIADDFKLVEHVVYLTRRLNVHDVDLQEIAGEMGLDAGTVQDAFFRWGGTDVTHVLEALSRSRLEQRVNLSTGILDLPPGRLLPTTPVHTVDVEGITPEEYRRDGRNIELVYGIHPTRFGDVLIAVHGHGICAMRFVDGDVDTMLDDLQAEWPLSPMSEDRYRTEALVNAAFEHATRIHLTVLLRGTPMQVGIWSSLLRIPPGYLVAYIDIAEYAGNPMAFRVVSETVLLNPVAYLIPCHRVVRETGMAGGYRWDPQRKKLIIAWEGLHYTIKPPSFPGS